MIYVLVCFLTMLAMGVMGQPDAAAAWAAACLVILALLDK